MTRVAVVGAGSAGLSAAISANERGANVTILESGGVQGPKSDWPALLESRDRRSASLGRKKLDAAGIRVEPNQRVTRIGKDLVVRANGTERHFDAVVLATGSAAITEKLDGMRKRGVHVLDSRAAFSGLGESLGDYGTAAVYGSGPVALEVAGIMKTRGLRVSLMAPGGAVPMLNPGPRKVLLDGISSWGIAVSDLRPDKVVGVDRVEAVTALGEVVPCDSFVVIPRLAPSTPEVPCALGRSGGPVVDGRMQSTCPGLFASGDCAEVRMGPTTMGVMFESSAKVMGSVAGANAAGGSVSATVVGSFFKEIVGVEVVASGLSLSEAAGLGIKVVESSKSWRGELACSLVFESDTRAIIGAQLAGKGVGRFAESIPLMVATRSTVEQLAFQETIVSSDISPIVETAREGLRERRQKS